MMWPVVVDETVVQEHVKWDIGYRFKKKPRALIVGHTGNLGQACVDHAVARNWEYLGMSRGAGYKLNSFMGAWNALINLGQWDLVVFAQGTQQKITLSDRIVETQWQDIIDNNLKSCVTMTNALVSKKALREGSLIVYVSSIQATQPREGRGLYAVAKAGVEALTRAAAVELAPKTRTVCLRLGQMTETMKGIDFPDDQVRKIQEKTPLPWVDAKDVAEFIFGLYFQPSITGEVIEISSGHKFSVWPE